MDSDITNYDSLTPKQKQICKYIAYGFTTKEIADLLCVSLVTVKTHLIGAFQRLNLTNYVNKRSSHLRCQLTSIYWKNNANDLAKGIPLCEMKEKLKKN